jgi:hypothetical protein
MRGRVTLVAVMSLIAAGALASGALASGGGGHPRHERGSSQRDQRAIMHVLTELSRMPSSHFVDVDVRSARAIVAWGHAVGVQRESGVDRAQQASAAATPRSTVVVGKLNGVILSLGGVEDEVARYVPAPLRVFPGGGHAELLLDFISFENVTVDGRPIPDFVRSGLFAITFPGPGAPTPVEAYYTPVETYSVWFLSSDPGIVAGLAGVGLGCRTRSTFSCRVPRLTLQSSEEANPVASITGDVPWQFSPYSISATFPSWKLEGVGVPANRHWYDGVRGLVSELVAFSDSASAAGVGTIRPAPGTPLFDMLGNQGSVSAPALALRTRFEAIFTVGW